MSHRHLRALSRVLFHLNLACCLALPAAAQECLNYPAYAPWTASIETGGLRALVERAGAVTILGEQGGRLRFIENAGTPDARLLREDQLAPIMCIGASDTFVFVSCDYTDDGDTSYRVYRIYSLADPGNIRLLQSGCMQVAVSYPYTRQYYAVDCVFHDAYLLVTAHNDYARGAVWMFERGANGLFSEKAVLQTEYQSGLACTGRHCYVANADDRIKMYDLESSPPLAVVGSLELNNIDPVDVVISGDHLYAGGSYGDLVTCSIDGIGAPELLSVTPVGAGRLALIPAGPERLVVADRGLGAYTVDIGDPAAPAVTGRIPTPGGARDAVWIGADKVAAATDAGLCFLDFSLPTVDPVVGTSPFLSWGARRSGGRLYSGYGDTLRVYDQDDAGQWRQLGSTATGLPPVKIYPHGDLVFCASQFFVLQYGGCLVDVSDPAAPTPLLTLNHACDDAAFAGDHLYVSNSVVFIYDLAYPHGPALVGTGVAGAGQIEIEGDRAYVGVRSADFGTQWGLRICSVAAPRIFAELGSLEMPQGISAIAARDGLVVLTAGNDLFVVDARDPASPFMVGCLALGRETSDIVLDGDIACLSTSRGVAFVDVADPASPSLLGSMFGEWTSQISLDEGILATHMSYRVVDLLPNCATATPTYLAAFAAEPRGPGVGISWRLTGSSGTPLLRLTGHRGPAAWVVPYLAESGGSYRATDDSPGVAEGGDIRYVLEMSRSGGSWEHLGEVTVSGLPGVEPGFGRIQPNPFNAQASIEYRVRQAGPVKVRVFDVQGRQVATLVDVVQEAGTYTAEWTGLDDAGLPASSGVYCLRFECGAVTRTARLSLVK